MTGTAFAILVMFFSPKDRIKMRLHMMDIKITIAKNNHDGGCDIRGLWVTTMMMHFGNVVSNMIHYIVSD